MVHRIYSALVSLSVRLKNCRLVVVCNELARQHRMRAQKTGADYSEYINPNTAFGSSRRIRFITERLPHTHIFFTEANAIDQFERVLTQASRVEEGRIVKNAGISVNEILGEFTAAKIQGDYRVNGGSLQRYDPVASTTRT